MRKLVIKRVSILAALAGLGLAFVLGLNSWQSSQATDLDGNNFNPGRIIDDDIFTNKDSMTVEEIQFFLERHVRTGACDRNKTNDYVESREDLNPPWTCLFEFEQNIVTGESNYGLFEEDGSPSQVEGGISAAQIIWQAAQDHQINPQVLIVLLQKEQGLVTDNWPYPRQFKHATGYLCPDTPEGCDETAGGFYNQVNGGARLFRYYLDHPDEYWYSIGTNQILYHPYNDCGRQTIEIQNAATVALYLYTPYVPNQAALDNLFAVGDSCSAYGNRNFWAYFSIWFGSPINGQSPPSGGQTDQPTPEPPSTNQALSAEINHQAIYSDIDKDNLLVSGLNTSLLPDQVVYLSVEIKNTGTATWDQAALTRIGDEDSPFCPNQQWINLDCQTAAISSQSTAPNEVLSLSFAIEAPSQPTTWVEQFSLFVDNEQVPGSEIELRIQVLEASNSADLHWQGVFVDSSRQQYIGWHADLAPNQTAWVIVQLENTGTTSWTKSAGPNQVVLTSLPPEQPSQICHQSWRQGCRQVGVLVQDKVDPGEIGTFAFSIVAPASTGIIVENFGLFNQDLFVVGSEVSLGVQVLQ